MGGDGDTVGDGDAATTVAASMAAATGTGSLGTLMAAADSPVVVMTAMVMSATLTLAMVREWLATAAVDSMAAQASMVEALMEAASTRMVEVASTAVVTPTEAVGMGEATAVVTDADR